MAITVFHMGAGCYLETPEPCARWKDILIASRLKVPRPYRAGGVYNSAKPWPDKIVRSGYSDATGILQL